MSDVTASTPMRDALAHTTRLGSITAFNSQPYTNLIPNAPLPFEPYSNSLRSIQGIAHKNQVLQKGWERMIKDGAKSDSPLSCGGLKREENTPYLYHDLYH